MSGRSGVRRSSMPVQARPPAAQMLIQTHRTRSSAIPGVYSARSSRGSPSRSGPDVEDLQQEVIRLKRVIQHRDLQVKKLKTRNNRLERDLQRSASCVVNKESREHQRVAGRIHSKGERDAQLIAKMQQQLRAMHDDLDQKDAELQQLRFSSDRRRTISAELQLIELQKEYELLSMKNVNLRQMLSSLGMNPDTAKSIGNSILEEIQDQVRENQRELFVEMREEISALRADNANMVKQIAAMKVDLDIVNTQIGTRDSQIEALRKEIAFGATVPLSSELPVMEARMREMEQMPARIQSQMQKRIDCLVTALDDQSKLAIQLQDSLDEQHAFYEEKLGSYASIDQQFESYSSQIVSLTDQLAAAHLDIKRIDEEKSVLEEQLNSIDFGESDRLRTQVADQIKMISVLEARFRAVEVEKQHLESKYQGLADELTETKRSLFAARVQPPASQFVEAGTSASSPIRASSAHTSTSADHVVHGTEDFIHEFEKRFSGERESLKAKRLSVPTSLSSTGPVEDDVDEFAPSPRPLSGKQRFSFPSGGLTPVAEVSGSAISTAVHTPERQTSYEDLQSQFASEMRMSYTEGKADATVSFVSAPKRSEYGSDVESNTHSGRKTLDFSSDSDSDVSLSSLASKGTSGATLGQKSPITASKRRRPSIFQVIDSNSSGSELESGTDLFGGQASDSAFDLLQGAEGLL